MRANLPRLATDSNSHSAWLPAPIALESPTPTLRAEAPRGLVGLPKGRGIMLILTRRVGETVMIGDDVTITVLGVKGNKLRIERYETLAEAKDAALKI